jgi:hypothetical protein|tara:strand:- start:236 stop:1051 length:816 start_codon:yes stop_codon:yes gene_type:complete
MNYENEQALRANIRSLISYVKTKKLAEEKELRGIIRSFLDHEMVILSERQTADVDPTPNKSTGINVLEELLKKIVPVLEDDFKSMTTDPEQRKSFRAHIVQAIIDTLTPVEANTKAGDDEAAADGPLDEEIDIEITDGDSDAVEDDKFIDIRTDSEISAEAEPADPRDDFGIEGADETGRNIAYSTFKKIESNIIDSYELLSNPEDQELFYDYLIANTKLYFDKFETELSGSVEEPTNQAYDMAKNDAAGDEEAMMEDISRPTADEIALGL